MSPWYQPVVINQLVNYHIENSNIQDAWRILILMLTSEFSKKQLEVMVRLWNLISFTLWKNISKWAENFVQDHPNCIFEELEQSFCKCFQTMKNDEEVYMQLRTFQQQIDEWVEIYYKCLLKFINYLQIKATNVILTMIFRVGL
jgi:hypothetical protein